MIITEDIAKTILAGCYKFGAATMLRENGATMTKVIEVYEEKILRSEQEQGQEWKDSKARVQGLHNVHPRFGRGGQFLDDYNQIVYDDIVPTITTKIITSCHYFIYEEDKRKDIQDCWK